MRLTEPDRDALAFAVEHRIVLAAQLAVLLEVSPAAAARRAGRLAGAGYLERRTIFHSQPGCLLVTARGLAAVGSPLPRPTVDLRGYLHDLGLGWLHLAARSGALGPVAEVIGERRMRSADGLPRPADHAAAERPARFGIPLWAVGAGTSERLHYPDLVLRTPAGATIAVEFELTAKSRARMDKIMTGYGSAAAVERVLYLTDRPAVARVIRAAAERNGVADRVEIQPFAWTASMRPLADALSSARGRSPGARIPRERGGAER